MDRRSRGGDVAVRMHEPPPPGPSGSSMPGPPPHLAHTHAHVNGSAAPAPLSPAVSTGPANGARQGSSILDKLSQANEEAWLVVGRVSEQMGNLEQAMSAYETALRHNPRSLNGLTQMAGIARIKENYALAIDYFQRVLKLPAQDTNGEIWSALGHCFLMQDDLQKAYSAYQQALYLLPNPKEDPKLWYGIGILYDRYGSLDHAEEAFSSVLRMNEELEFDKANEILFRLGIIYKQQGKFDESLNCFDRILRNPPSPLAHADIWFQIGHVYEQQKDHVRAKHAYERVVADNPQHAKVLQQLGWLYHQDGSSFQNQEHAIQYLTKSLEADSSDAQSWYLLGRAYMAGQKYNKAYEAYQQAVYRDGRNPTFWCSIGVLYFQINQYRDALDAYSRAIRINPYISEVWFDLGSLYESCNNQISDAIDAYARASELDPSNTVITQRLQLLKNAQATGGQLPVAPGPQDVHPTAYASAVVPPPGLTGPSLMLSGQRPPFRPDSRAGEHPPGGPGHHSEINLPPPNAPQVANGAPGAGPGGRSPPFHGGPPPPVIIDDSRHPPAHAQLAPMDVDRPPRDFRDSRGGGGPHGSLLLQPSPGSPEDHPMAPPPPPGAQRNGVLPPPQHLHHPSQHHHHHHHHPAESPSASYFRGPVPPPLHSARPGSRSASPVASRHDRERERERERDRERERERERPQSRARSVRSPPLLAPPSAGGFQAYPAPAPSRSGVGPAQPPIASGSTSSPSSSASAGPPGRSPRLYAPTAHHHHSAHSLPPPPPPPPSGLGLAQHQPVRHPSRNGAPISPIERERDRDRERGMPPPPVGRGYWDERERDPRDIRDVRDPRDVRDARDARERGRASATPVRGPPSPGPPPMLHTPHAPHHHHLPPLPPPPPELERRSSRYDPKYEVPGSGSVPPTPRERESRDRERELRDREREREREREAQSQQAYFQREREWERERERERDRERQRKSRKSRRSASGRRTPRRGGSPEPEQSGSSTTSSSVGHHHHYHHRRPPARVVDEDYDEPGVADALIGLAQYRAPPPPQQQQQQRAQSQSRSHSPVSVGRDSGGSGHRDSVSSTRSMRTPPPVSGPMPGSAGLKRMMSPDISMAEGSPDPKRARTTVDQRGELKRRPSSPAIPPVSTSASTPSTRPSPIPLRMQPVHTSTSRSGPSSPQDVVMRGPPPSAGPHTASSGSPPPNHLPLPPHPRPIGTSGAASSSSSGPGSAGLNLPPIATLASASNASSPRSTSGRSPPSNHSSPRDRMGMQVDAPQPPAPQAPLSASSARRTPTPPSSSSTGSGRGKLSEMMNPSPPDVHRSPTTIHHPPPPQNISVSVSGGPAPYPPLDDRSRSGSRSGSGSVSPSREGKEPL